MRVLIIEDEPLIAQRLAREVQAFFGARLQALSIGDDLDSTSVSLREGAIDLLLLDLNVHGDDGFRLLQLVGEGTFRTIVVSAHAERALQAFDFGVLDFVAKPFSQARLFQAFQRFNDAAGAAKARSLLVKKMGGIEVLAIERISHIRADGHYSQVQMCDGACHFHDLSLDRLLEVLPQHFLRVHRSYAVNMQHFTRLHIEAGGKYSVDTHFASGIPVSRTLYPVVRNSLAKL